MCAVCGHEVERVSWTIDPDRGGTKLIAYCHGDSDTMFISQNDLYLDGPNGPLQAALKGGVVGTAFATKRLP